ncbi:MAG: hypothetical protein M0P77_09710 [Firmicutes bacterium]|nr:hypothetical protein [Bacillota bacterium]
MEVFNKEKVKKIAIDKIERQQLYVSDSKKEHLIIKQLTKMGFEISKNVFDKQQLGPFVVNTIDKNTYKTRASLVACAISCGARVISYSEMMELIDKK